MQHLKNYATPIRVIMSVMMILGAVFVARLFYLQVIKHEYYQTQANQEHTTKFTIPAKRGLIYARDGTGYAPMVLNEPAYIVYADPRYVKDVDKVADTLRRVAGGNIVSNFEDSLRDTSRQYVVLAKGLNSDQANLLKKAKLSGIGMQEIDKRVYPEGQLAAQILGFVNGDGQGQYGIEGGINDTLTGKDGQLRAVTDVYGIPISIGSQNVQTPAQNGKNAVLTIDRNIQNKVEQALKAGLDHAKATIGSVIVMDPSNGHIMAMANLPTYDPNNFTQVTDYNLFQNRIISQPYEPGSVIKALTMAAGLDLGIIQPDTRYNNLGYVKVDDAVIRNALNNPLGMLTMTQVLQYSFNTGAVWVLQQMGGGDINMAGEQKLYDYFTKHYLFGRSTGIELAGEVSGYVTPPQSASRVQYANMSFGQGVDLSMLQVASAFAAAVNGGTYYTPQIVDGYLGDDGQTFIAKPPTIREPVMISPTASAKLRQMLHDAREGSTAAEGELHGYYFGGKTGTAQVYDPKTGKYSDTQTIGSYLGFEGQDKPQYVIMVRVDDATIGGFSGSAAAAPIFTDISNWLVNYLQIAPKG